jgi:hypothetical protein
MNPSNPSTAFQPPDGSTRREFLGFLGVALLSPSLTPTESPSAAVDTPVYLGPVQELAAGLPIGAGWKLSFDDLIESVDLPISEWVLSQVTAMYFEAKYSLAELPSILRSRGVRRACEVFYHEPELHESYFVNWTMYHDCGRCTEGWHAIETVPAEAGLDPLAGIGDVAVVSLGKWCVPGKIFFRRGNVLVSVFPNSSNRDARQFATMLDQRIIELLS